MCSSQADVGHAMFRANTARESKRAVRCQVRDCCIDLSELGKPYCLRKRVCPTHLTAEVVLLDAVHHGDEEFRFCHQCGKLEALAVFEGAKRSCRTRLLRRRISQQKYRKKMKKRASSDRDSTYTEGDSNCHNEDSDAANKRSRHMFPKTDIQNQPDPTTATAATPSDDAALNQLGSTPFPAALGVAAAAATVGQQQQQQQALAWDAVSPSGLVQPGPLHNMESFSFASSDAAVAAAAAAAAAHHSSNTPATLAHQASVAHTQQQQQGVLGSCYPAAPASNTCSTIDPLWDEMLQALADCSNSITHDNDNEPLFHIEHELATEQQQQEAASAVHGKGFTTMSTKSSAMPATSSCSRQLSPGTSLGPNWQQVLGTQQQQQVLLLQTPNQATAAAAGCQPRQLSAALSMQCSPASVGNSMVMTGGFPSPLNVPLAPAAAAAAMPATMDISEPPANTPDLAQLQQTVNDLTTKLAQLKSDVEASVGHMMVNPSRPRPMMNTHALGMLLRQAAELLQQQEEMQQTQQVMPAALEAQPAPVLHQMPQGGCGTDAAAAMMWQQYMQP